MRPLVVALALVAADAWAPRRAPAAVSRSAVRVRGWNFNFGGAPEPEPEPEPEPAQSYGKRAIRSTKVGDMDVLDADNRVACLTGGVGIELIVSAQKCAAKAGGNLCGINTISDWDPNLVTSGVALIALGCWLGWYGTNRRLAVDPGGLGIVRVDRDDKKSGLEVSRPESWCYGASDRVAFGDVDDWAVLPVGLLYVRERARTASGTDRKVSYFYAPSFDTKTVEALLGPRFYDVPAADPEDSILGTGSKAGAAGIVSYIAWEWAFWIGSFGGAALLFLLYEGRLPDLAFATRVDFGMPASHYDLLKLKSSMLGVDLPAFPLVFDAANPGDFTNVATSAFVVVNLARLILPLRLGLALATAPFFERTVVSPFKQLTGKADE